MSSARNGPGLQKLLTLCDDLRRIRTRMMDPELATEAKSRLRRQSKRKCEQLARSLAEYRFHGPLGEVMRSFQLQTEHFQVLAMLLHCQMRSEDPTLEGRLILSSLYQTPFEVLASLSLLQPESPLRAAGLVCVADEDEAPVDVLEARFRLSDDALEAFRGEITGLVPQDLKRRGRKRYDGHREFVTDLRILHNLYKHRRDRLFSQDRWNRLHVGSPAAGRALTRRIESFWGKIKDRVEATPEAAGFPALRFMKEHALTERDLVIVLHLLFRELYEGNAYVDVVDLLKLVSDSDDDLVRNRALVHSTSPLIRHEILKIETMLDGRVLTGEAHLTDWVVNAVLGAPANDRAIHPDERIRWHEYLAGMDDTQGFFRDLEAH